MMQRRVGDDEGSGGGGGNGIPTGGRPEEVFAELGLVGESPAIRSVRDDIVELARRKIPILFTGESGTGKNVCAKAVHRLYRPKAPFVRVDCNRLGHELAGSYLYGHRKGAFTGASEDRQGLLACADGGTLFLDEVGDLESAGQDKLLWVLESGRFRPVGSDEERSVEFRLVAASHRDLPELVRREEFREDLLYRLQAEVIAMPPLRARPGDVPALARHFLRERDGAPADGPVRLAPDAEEELKRRRWPGNVRQLKTVVEHAAKRAGGARELQAAHLESVEILSIDEGVDPPADLEEALNRTRERCVRRALARADGNKSEAAELLGISRTTLYRYLADLEDVP